MGKSVEQSVRFNWAWEQDRVKEDFKNLCLGEGIMMICILYKFIHSTNIYGRVNTKEEKLYGIIF